MNINCDNRFFQIWKYHVSHPNLLVRSPKNREYKTNIDIIFYDVKLINLPSIFHGTRISSISQTDDMDLIKKIENMGYDINEVIVFHDKKQKFYVIASIIKIEENEDDLF